MPEPSSSFITTILNSELIRWLVTEIVQFWKERRFQGIYTVNDHISTLELCDQYGNRAVYTKHQTLTFTQNEVFAIQDQAWGDGEIFADYWVSPGVAVDRYEEGHRWKILISLRQTRNRGETESFYMERTIKNGFLDPVNNFSVHVDHPTGTISLAVIFPKNRHPKRVTLLQQNARRSTELGNENTTSLSNGRIQYYWQMNKPRLFEEYSLRWEW